MIVGASFLYGKDVVVYSKWYGKLATVLFYFAIVFSLVIKQFNLVGFWNNFAFRLILCCIICYYLFFNNVCKSFISKGFIDKQDLKKRCYRSYY